MNQFFLVLATLLIPTAGEGGIVPQTLGVNYISVPHRHSLTVTIKALLLEVLYYIIVVFYFSSHIHTTYLLILNLCHID